MIIQGKKVLITGGAKRVGKMFVKKFQQLGADVVVHYNNSEDEAKLLSNQTVKFDLSDPANLPNIFKEIGPIDILINNASAFNKDRLLNSTYNKVLKEISVNFFSPFEIIRQFALQDKEGVILNILDRRIKANDISCVPYSLSKKALAELTYSSAIELAPKIRVNAVAPGPILAPDNVKVSDYVEKSGNIPLLKNPDPNDLINAGIHLIENNSVTGQVIYVDGGQHLLGNGI